MKHGLLRAVLIFASLAIICSCAGGPEYGKDDLANRMQEFVINISNYAKAIKPGFIIIPQNGSELAFKGTEPGNGIRQDYISAIDGMGIEELFYDAKGKAISDNERLSILRTVKSNGKTIIVSDYVSSDADFSNSLQKNRAEEFIAFPRSKNNYHYKEIPALTDPNDTSIDELPKAKNYLYLISTDSYPGDRAGMLNAIKATNYDIVLIDLFFEGEVLLSSEIDSLKTKQNGARRLVIAYVSIGSAEKYRYYFQKGWKKGSPSWIKKNYAGYSDEFWVEFWDPEWQNIIYKGNNSYIKQIIDAGFDGAYLDNVEAYYFLSN